MVLFRHRGVLPKNSYFALMLISNLPVTIS